LHPQLPGVDAPDFPLTTLYGVAMSAELDTEVKIFIVQALACFDRPSKVVRDVKAEFGAVVTRQAVHWYAGDRKGAEAIPLQWREMFAATRKRFLEETADIGIANRAVRLRKLDRIAELAEAAGNHVIVMAACEAAAKETGGAFTNRHEHTGAGGKDLLPAPGAVFILPDNGRGDYDFSNCTTEQLTQMYRDVAANKARLVVGPPTVSDEKPEPPSAAESALP
jgi:hypothetical protein